MKLYSKYLEKELITSQGKNQIKEVEELKKFLIHIFLGGNPRDFRENGLKKRLVFSNVSLFKLILNYEDLSDEEYIEMLKEDYNFSKNDNQRIIPLWLSGITKKGLDNIARGNLELFLLSLKETLNHIPKELEQKYGALSGEVLLNNKNFKIDWGVLTRLLISSFAQGLTIKGSEKSASGKIWEKLVLGNILSIFGFEYLEEPDYSATNSFWLSNEGDGEREIDATIIKDEKLIYIDIGFIGKGNPEISLDKVTRFKTEVNLNKRKLNVSTIIIVDTIGKKSGIIEKTEDYQAYILQMNSVFWTIDFCDIIRKIFGKDSAIDFNRTVSKEKRNKEYLKNYFEEKLSLEILNKNRSFFCK